MDGTTISPSSNDPAVGNPRHYYDESHALIGDIAAGQTVTLQKDGDDTAAYYVIDLIDLELVNPPLPQPAGSLSITADCGATPDDASDDRAAIQNCINRRGHCWWPVYSPRNFQHPEQGERPRLGRSASTTSPFAGPACGTPAVRRLRGLGCRAATAECSVAVFGDTVLRND
jgi:hypothetical protein